MTYRFAEVAYWVAEWTHWQWLRRLEGWLWENARRRAIRQFWRDVDRQEET